MFPIGIKLFFWEKNIQYHFLLKIPTVFLQIYYYFPFCHILLKVLVFEYFSIGKDQQIVEKEDENKVYLKGICMYTVQPGFSIDIHDTSYRLYLSTNLLLYGNEDERKICINFYTMHLIWQYNHLSYAVRYSQWIYTAKQIYLLTCSCVVG